MRAYNLYYNRNKINKKPLSKELVRELMQSDVITKKINDAEIQQFKTKDVRVVECIIV